MGSVIGIPRPIKLGDIPRRLSSKIPRPYLAWSSAVRTGIKEPYDYARQAITASPDATAIITQRYGQYEGLFKSVSGTGVHASDALVLDSASFNVVVHAVLAIQDCGTNAANFTFRAAAASGGVAYTVGIAVNNSGVAGIRIQGGSSRITGYLPKAYATRRIISVSAVEAGQTVYFFADGRLVGSVTHADPTRTFTPRAELVYSNVSGTEPTLAVLQYAVFAVPSNGYALAQYLSEGPDRLWDAESIWVPVSAGGGGGTSLLPSSITSSESFGTASIVRGNVNVLVSSISSSEVFGNHVVSNGTLSIVPSGIASAELFGTTQILRGVRIVTPTGIASSEAFGTGSVLKGTLVIYPNGIPSGELFGLPAVTGGIPSTVTAIFYVRGFSSFGFRRNN